MSAPTIQLRPRGRTAKVVVTGPFDAGKSTLIHTLCGGDVVTTERPVAPTSHAADATSSGQTTVAMDHGRIPISDDLTLALVGTPGQDRFGFMWDILAEGMIGYVLVVDASRAASLTEARTIRRRVEQDTDVPSVVAVNKATDDPERAVRRTIEALELPPNVPVIAIDARVKADGKQVLVALLRQAQSALAGTSSGATAREGQAG
jgi:small GTP-binding protein